MVEIKTGAFKPPLTESGLQVLGLATYNWGMADALLQILIEKIGHHTRSETAPLSIGRKADRLLSSLAGIQDPEAARLAEQFAREIKELNEGRNHAIHGFWGWHGDDSDVPYRSAAYSFKAEDPLFADEIVILSNRIAEATIKGHRASLAMDGVVKTGDEPNDFYFGKRNPFAAK